MKKPRPLRRTALILGVLFVLDLGYAGQGLFSLAVATGGVILLLIGALAAVVRQRPEVAKTRLARAGIYLLLGAATLGMLRFHAFTAESHAAQIIDACRAFKDKNGAFPNTLQALVPEFLPGVPRAKYVMAFGDFSYWTSSPTAHTLMYTALAPFGRRVYSLEAGSWSSID